jgi:hypothetical protein
MTAIGEVFFLEGKYADAEARLREALRVHEKAAPNAWRRYQTQSLLGAALARQGKRDEAEPLLESGHQGLNRLETNIPFEFRALIEDSGDWLAQLRHDRKSTQARAAK